MSRRIREDAVAAARRHASASAPSMAARWARLADRVERLRKAVAKLEWSNDDDAMRAELEARIERYINADRGEDLAPSIRPQDTDEA